MKNTFIPLFLLLFVIGQPINAQGYYIYKNGIKKTVRSSELDSLVFFNIEDTANNESQKNISFDELQSSIDRSGNVQLDAGIYQITQPLSVKSNTRITGVPGGTIFQLGNDCEICVELTGNIEDVIFEGITFVGKNPSTSRPDVPTIQEVKEIKGKNIDENSYAKDCGIYIHAGGWRITVENCTFKDFGYAGIKIDHTLSGSGGFRYAPIVDKCRFYNNYYGVFVGERGEFANIGTCEFNKNVVGVCFLSSNTRIISCQMTQNYLFGLLFVGGYENGGHTVIGDCEFVHNGFNSGNKNYPGGRGTYDILLIDGGGGVTFSNCYIGIDGIMLHNVSGFAFVGCQLICPVYIETAKGCNMFHDCMWRNHNDSGTIV